MQDFYPLTENFYSILLLNTNCHMKERHDVCSLSSETYCLFKLNIFLLYSNLNTFQ